jgi:hypothetical protein
MLQKSEPCNATKSTAENNYQYLEDLIPGLFIKKIIFPCEIRTHNRLIRRSGIPPIVVGGMLGHSLAIYRTATLCRLARFARNACNISETQDEAARVMDGILIPIPVDLKSLNLKS